MKTLYKCEKCGMVFDDSDKCWEHEYSHWTLERGYHSLTATLDNMTEYKEGQDEPNIIHVMFTRWNSEKSEYEKRCGKFKLISSYDAPLVIENE